MKEKKKKKKDLMGLFFSFGCESLGINDRRKRSIYPATPPSITVSGRVIKMYIINESANKRNDT